MQDVEGDGSSEVRDLALKLIKKLVDEVAGNSPSHSAHLLLVLEKVGARWKFDVRMSWKCGVVKKGKIHP